MTVFSFRLWWDGLSKGEQEAYVDRIPSTWNYIDKQVKNRHRRPSKEFMEKMAAAGQGAFTYKQLLDDLYVDDKARGI